MQLYEEWKQMKFDFFKLFYFNSITRFLWNNDLQLFLYVIWNYPLRQNCGRSELLFEATNVVKKRTRLVINFNFLKLSKGNRIYFFSLNRNCPVLFLNIPLKLGKNEKSLAQDIVDDLQPSCNTCKWLVVSDS